MGILEEIANPKTNSFLESLKVFEGIETNRISRRLMEMQAGLTLQKMQAAKQAQQQQAQGYQTIADFMRPQTGGNTTPREQSNVVPEAERKNLIVQNPNQPTYMMQGAQNAPSPAETTIPGETPAQPTFMQQSAEGQPSPQTDIIPKASAALTPIPTEDIGKMSFTDLGMTLSKNPQMQQEAAFWLDYGNKVEKKLAEQTADEKADAQKMIEIYGNSMREAAQLEDAGDTIAAKQAYEQNMNNILSDPSFKDNPDVQKFFNHYKDYQPNRAKFVYSISFLGQKSRNDYETAKARGETLAESQRHNAMMEQIADEKTMVAKLKANKPESFKSADANTIYRMAVGFHGGIFDENRQLKFLDPEKAQDVQDLSEMAAILYSRGNVKTHNEAISEAARQLKMKKTAPAEDRLEMLMQSFETPTAVRDAIGKTITLEEGKKILIQKFNMKAK